MKVINYASRETSRFIKQAQAGIDSVIGGNLTRLQSSD